MAELEQGLEELKVVKQSFKDNFESEDISTENVEFRNMPDLVKGMEKKLPHQTKEVEPSTSVQNVVADAGYKLTGVKVNAVNPSDYYKPEQTVNVTPKTTSQIITPSGNTVYNRIDVSAVTSAIDANIIPTNIRKGKTILGVTGNLEADKPDQQKTVNPTRTQQSIVADTGYELSRVTVNAVTSAIDSNIKSTNIRKGVDILGVTGTLEEHVTPKLQSKTVYPTTNLQQVTADSGYDGLSKVNVEAVKPSDYYKPENSITVTPTTSEQTITPTAGVVFNKVNVSAVTKTIDPNIKAENIKQGVTILGEVGTLVAGTGGSGDLLDVDVLPSENVEDNKVYRVVNTVGEYYFAFPDETPLPLKQLLGYHEIFVDNIDNVTDPIVSMDEYSLYVYTDKSTYIGYLFYQSVDMRVTLAELFGLSAEQNGGIIDDIFSIPSAGVYYLRSASATLGIPMEITNKEVMEYVDGEWRKYVRLTNDMVSGVWYWQDRNEYLELKANGTLVAKSADGEVIDNGTYEIFYRKEYGSNFVCLFYNSDPLYYLYEYKVVDNVVTLGNYVKQSDYVVSGGTEVSSKLGQLVDGTLETIEAGDLVDVTTIRNGAFKGLTYLTSVVIPNSVVEIGDEAFAGCTALTDIIVKATTSPQITNTSLPDNVQRIYVPSGSYYEYISGWHYYADKIVRTFDTEEVPNATGTTLNIVSDNYTETMNDKNGYTLEIGG